MDQQLRKLARVEHMVKTAIEQATAENIIYIVVLNREHEMLMYQLIGRQEYPLVRVKCIADIHDFDWNTLRPRGDQTTSQYFIDARLIEYQFESVLSMLRRFDLEETKFDAFRARMSQGRREEDQILREFARTIDIGTDKAAGMDVE